MLQDIISGSGSSALGWSLADDGGGSEAILVPDAELLFGGHFKKVGADLVILGEDGTSFVARGYFHSGRRADLQSPDGGLIAAENVDILAGANLAQYAQTEGESGRAAIGRVETVTGMATATRNGVIIVLQAGDRVFKHDLVETAGNSSCGISFLDGTAFNLTQNCRMVLNEMVYDPSGGSSALFSLVKGSISFVAGQVAKTGEMKVNTPVATMGIRGTSVYVEITSENGPTKYAVLPDADGKVGSFKLYRTITNPDGKLALGAEIATVSEVGKAFTVTPSGQVVESLMTPTELQNALAVVAKAFEVVNMAPPPAPNPDDREADPGREGNLNGPTRTAAGSGGEYKPDIKIEISQSSGGASPSPGQGDPPPIVVKVTDGTGGSTTFELPPVTPPRPTPTGEPDHFAAQENVAIVLAPGALLANDTAVPTIAAVGDPVHGTVAMVNGSIVFTPEPNYSGPASFTYTPEGGAPIRVDLTIGSVASAPQLAVAPAQGSEDSPIPLDIAAALGGSDPSETLLVTISGVPEGAYLSSGTRNADGTWTLSPAQLSGLNLTPPSQGSGAIVLTVRATVTDVGDGPGAGTATTSREATLTIDVTAVADAPQLAVAPAAGEEDATIPLSIAAALVDTDGSESLTITIAGVPDGVVLSRGTSLGEGVWALTAADLPGLTLTMPADRDTGFTLTVTATATEAGGGSASTVATLAVEVTPANDAPVLAPVPAPTATFTERVDASAQKLALVKGTLSVSDRDTGDLLTASAVSSSVTLNGAPLPPGLHVAALTALGALSFATGVRANGGDQGIDWIWDPAAANLDFLGAGDTLVVTYSVRVDDGSAASGTQDLVFQIEGTNDGTRLTSVNAGAVSTAATESTGDSSAQDLTAFHGALAFSDADLGDLLGASAGSPLLRLNGALYDDAELLSALGTGRLVFDTDVVSSGGAQTLGWIWDATEADLDFLGEDDQLTITYGVHVGDSAFQDLTFTIQGTNDRPVLSSVAGRHVRENSAGAVVGTFLASDVDARESLTFRVLKGGIVDDRFVVVPVGDGPEGQPSYYEVRLAPGKSFDFEAENADGNPSIVLTVEANDGARANHTAVADMNVHVTDVSEGGFLGKTLAYSYLHPTTNNVYYSRDVTVGPGVELSELYPSQGGEAALDITNDQIIIDFYDQGSWSGASFNGFRLRDELGTVGDIVGVRIAQSNLEGFAANDISFDNDNIYVNWLGLSFNPNTYIVLDVLFA